jgi:hypothetical protein
MGRRRQDRGGIKLITIQFGDGTTASWKTGGKMPPGQHLIFAFTEEVGHEKDGTTMGQHLLVHASTVVTARVISDMEKRNPAIGLWRDLTKMGPQLDRLLGKLEKPRKRVKK